MEPVPVTHTVRRTVRVAVVLVVGQALLCALIGWTVFGRPETAGRPPGAPVVDPLAEPPQVIPAPPGSTPRAPASTGPPRSVGAPPAPGRSARPASLPVVEPLVGVPPSAAPPSAGGSAPAPSEPARASGEPAPSTVDVAPGPLTEPIPTPAPTVPNAEERDEGGTPVRVGGPCRSPDAYAHTADGVLVQCLPDGEGPPRWKIVEQR